jgi:predicted nucleotidyltransferase
MSELQYKTKIQKVKYNTSLDMSNTREHDIGTFSNNSWDTLITSNVMSIVLLFINCDSYISINMTCKKSMVCFQEMLSYKVLKQNAYDSIAYTFLKKNCTIFGGYVRDQILNICPSDIDVLLSKDILKTLKKELLFEAYTNLTYPTEPIENLSNLLPHLLSNTVNYYLNDDTKNSFDIYHFKNVMKMVFNLDIIDVKLIFTQYTFSIITIKVFLFGFYISIDIKINTDEFTPIFKCNALLLNMKNGIQQYSTMNNTVKLEECIDDCKNKYANYCKNEIQIYKRFNHPCYKHCPKTHLDCSSNIYKRIVKMMNKGFIVQGLTQFTPDDIVPIEPCRLHCKTLSKTCKKCKSTYYVEQFHQYGENLFLCKKCCNYTTCVACNIEIHKKCFDKCYTCNKKLNNLIVTAIDSYCKVKKHRFLPKYTQIFKLFFNFLNKGCFFFMPFKKYLY